VRVQKSNKWSEERRLVEFTPERTFIDNRVPKLSAEGKRKLQIRRLLVPEESFHSTDQMLVSGEYGDILEDLRK